ncbi:MAG: MFS transporter [Alicyclobacillaceae bacterium]|jgi:predicted MFS family arabinose efflux permease|uniref:MFS transporter n=1 Tax=Alicyclobacillus sp. SP_1 TaxID=2942475 RepID=UPI002157117D|nr:MFS transporter [Alicyclobacillus sp. SP_1]MCY0887489.1 MFS transporter [Alicyclobacillaceae bacterium]
MNSKIGRGVRNLRLSRPFFIAFLLSLSYLLAYMQRTGPGVVSGTLKETFHVNAAVLGTMTSIQYLLYMLLQIPVGLSGDKYRPERLLAAGVFLDGVGTLLFATAHSFAVLLVGRAVVGLGDALIWVNIVLILARVFLPSQFGALLGVVSTAGNIGALLTTIPFAAWTAAEGWRIPFVVLAGLLMLTAVANFVVIRTDAPSKAPGVHLEYVPVGKTMRLVVRDRNAWATFFCHFATVGTYIGFVGLWAVPFFRATYDASRATATTFTLASFIGALIGGPFVGMLTDRLGSRRGTYIVVQVLVCLSWMMVPLFDGHPPRWVSYALMFLLGFGSGGSLLTFAVIRDQTPPARSGVTSGFANTGGFLSAVLLPILFGALFDLGKSHGTASHAYVLAFLVPVAFSLCGVIGSSFIKERQRVPEGGWSV